MMIALSNLQGGMWVPTESGLLILISALPKLLEYLSVPFNPV